MKKYTVIIPHRNSVKLLNRALSSIPESCKIIIVDNSDTKLEHEDIISTNKDLKILYSNPNLGAGNARNIGLKESDTKFVIFMDADDFFVNNVENLLIEYSNKSFDISYFTVDSVDSVSLEHNVRGDKYSKMIFNYLNSPSTSNLNYIRAFYLVPWGKIFSLDYIKKNNIEFEIVPASNDVMFSIISAFNTTNIVVDERKLYTVTSIKGSLTRSTNSRNIRSRFMVDIRRNKYLEDRDLTIYCINLFRPLLRLFSININDGLWGIKIMIKNRSNLFSFLCKYFKFN